MYTISMRPYCPFGAQDKCINFEQERSAWGMSTFKAADDSLSESVFGLCFRSPLENIDISVEQLAAMIAGLDVAYEEVCNALYAEAPTRLSKTVWKCLESFMECIPRGLYETAPALPESMDTRDVEPIPYLYEEASHTCLGWNGSRWGVIPTPADIFSYDHAGQCFGWDVCYKSSVMDTKCVSNPEAMARLLAVTLEDLTWLSTEARVYVNNIYSVQ